jgi:alpha-tubulin suppressor-like RCC1 family protein
LGFQWYHEGLPVAGATNRCLVIGNVQSSDAGNYVLVATNSAGQAASQPLNLVVYQGPAIVAAGAWGDNIDGQCNVSHAVANPCAIAAGAYHCLALNGDGTVVAWEKNWDGQANVPPTATNVVAIAAGTAHSLAVREDGSVIAWGRNGDGQTDVPAMATNVIAVSAGWAHSLALRADGTVVAWGNNDYGQTDAPFPAMDVIAIAAGYYHNVALRSDGTVVTWAFDYPTPPTASNVVAVAAGWEHCLALRADGSVVAWGDDSYGQSSVPASATNVVAISAGYYHNLALRADGSVIVWGKSYLGVTNVPAGLRNVVSVSAGEDYSVVLVATGAPRFGRQHGAVVAHAGGQAILNPTVVGTSPLSFQWFYDGVPILGATNRYLFVTYAQLAAAGNYVLVASNAMGLVSSAPVSLIVQPDPVTLTSVGAWGDNIDGQCSVSHAAVNPRAIAAGPYHSLALNEDGTVAAWGKNWDKQTNVPPSATNAMAVAAGGDFSLALKSDGSLVAWGRNWDGQTNVPPEATNVVSIAAGLSHSLALRSDGTVLVWGSNECGQTNVPLQATGLVAIAAGYYHNLALRSDHTVIAWGLETSVPDSATNVVAIAGGWWHSLALRADGSVIAWGDNSYDQCTVPASATNVVGISAGYSHSLALRADGTIVTWGKGSWGVTNIPAGLRNVTSIAAGQDYSLAMVECGPPRFGPQPQAAAVHVGGQVILSTSVSGTYPLALQWFHDGAAIAGATNTCLLLTSVQLAHAGSYTLMATNAAGQTDSQTEILTVNSEPAVDGVSKPQNVLIATSVCLPARVRGTVPLSCQWRLNGKDLVEGVRISGVNSRTLCLSATTSEDSGNYSLVVSNAYGCVTGLVAQISVSPILAWGDNFAGELDVPIGTVDIVALAAGGEHSLALRANGEIVAWGNNSWDQNNVPQSATNIIAVADGFSHSLALRADGGVVAWGDNSYGQTNVPPSATNVVAIAAGWGHSLALRFDGTFVNWGNYVYVPASATNVVAIAAGGSFLQADGVWGLASNVVSIAGGGGYSSVLALRADGTVLDNYGYTPVPTSVTNAVGMAAGGGHNLALLADGTVIAWGDNSYGQTLVPSQTTNVVAVSAGDDHSLALVGTGAPRIGLQPISCFARVGRSAVLAASSTGAFPLSWQWFHNGVPILGAVSPFLLLANVQRADAGSYTVTVTNPLGETNSHTARLSVQPEPFFASATTAQTVLVRTPVSFSPTIYGEQPMTYRWQLNGTDLIDGSRVIGAASSYLSLGQTELVETGDYSLIVSNAFGVITGLVAHLYVTPVSVWGLGYSGQTNVPPSATNVVAIATGDAHYLALRADGSIVAWGNGFYGETSVPLSATNVMAIAARDMGSMALRADGTVVAWGYNYYGQTNVPASATNVVDIAAGSRHSMALRADGTVVAWGYNSFGQANVPASATNVVGIAAGGYHSMALRGDGTLVAWGYNSDGETNVPASATKVVAITAGGYGSVALRADGTLVAWGSNSYGLTNVPASATNVVAIAAGESHNMALRADGSVVEWGYDYYGQTNVPPSTTNVIAIAAGDYGSMALIGENGQVPAFQPIERSVTIGASALLTAGSLGRARASFQWQFNGLDLPGATNAALWVGFANWTNAGIYRVIVSNVFGSTIGPPMVLTVLRTPLRFDTSSGGLQMTNGGLHLRLLGASGVGPVVLYASSNLLTWQPIYTNPPVIGVFEFSDREISNQPGRFYRAAEGEVPGPRWIEPATTLLQTGNGKFPLRVTGLTAEGPVVINASSNLLDGEVIFTNPPTIGPLQYLERPSTVQPQRFYRASENH